LCNPDIGVEGLPQRKKAVDVGVVQEEDRIKRSNGGIAHMAVATDIYMDAVVDGLETAAAATSISGSMVAESRPGVDTGEEVVRCCANISLAPLEITLQFFDVTRGIGFFARSMSDRPGPNVEWRSEGRVDRMELV
jgi:hypothetical protein